MGGYCLDRAVHAGLVSAGRDRDCDRRDGDGGHGPGLRLGPPLQHGGALAAAAVERDRRRHRKRLRRAPAGHAFPARRGVLCAARGAGRAVPAADGLGAAVGGRRAAVHVHDQHRRQSPQALPEVRLDQQLGLRPHHGRAGDLVRAAPVDLAAGLDADRRAGPHRRGHDHHRGSAAALADRDQAAEVPAETAAAQERLEGQRGVLHPAAGPCRLAAGMVRADPGQRLRHGRDVRRGAGPGQAALAGRRRPGHRAGPAASSGCSPRRSVAPG